MKPAPTGAGVCAAFVWEWRLGTLPTVQGDQLGLRRVFLAEAVPFIGSSAMAGAAQDMTWLITVRATQGVGAALIVPTTP